MRNPPNVSRTDGPVTSTGTLIDATRQAGRNRKGLWGAVALTLVLGTTQAGIAAQAGELPVPTQTVSLAGLNLAKAKDLAIARERLQAAAAEVCRSDAGKVDPTADAACKMDTYAAAIAKVNAYRSTLAIVTEMRVNPGVPSKVVSLADLDLGNSAHQDILRSRVRAAAKEVCKSTSGLLSIQADARCAQDTYASAMKKVSDQLVTAGLAAGVEHVARIY